MSDPAKSSAEIEDVLSSIRRLVSEHHATGAARETAPEGVSEPAADADKLVLTPALRVSDADVETTADTATDTDAHAPETVRSDDTTEGFAPDDRLADFGAVEADTGAERDVGTLDTPNSVEPDDAEGHADTVDISVPPADSAQDGRDPQDDFMQSAGADSEAGFEPETGDEDWPGGGADRALRDLVEARAPVTPEEPEQTAGDAAEPVAVGDETESSSDAFQETHPEDEFWNVPEADDAAVEPQSEHDQPGDDDPEKDTTEEGAAAASETDPGPPRAERPRPDWTPIFSRREPPAEGDPAAGEDTRADAPTDAEDADHVSQSDASARYDDVEDLGDEPSPFGFRDDDDDTFDEENLLEEESILDEETLREIIVDVVREELQGALGQRLTRNVRKMVRREIRLALAAEDLE